ncbi:MAG TPA: MMPL family transporter, partial [Gaiellaceae bacterium]|nr:MMPL family transporter [Gaiellaceae bacterium]
MKLNITARAARWSAAHWKTATLVWLAFVVAAVVLGGMAGKKGLTDSESSTGETARAETMLEKAGFDTPTSESVLVQAKHGGLRGETRTVVSRLKGNSDTERVRVTQWSKDGRSALVEFDLKDDNNVSSVLNTVSNLQRAGPAFTVAEFGSASIDQQASDRINKNLAKAEMLSMPITFLVLLLAFGALVAAGIPVLLAMSAVLAAIGLDSLISHVWHTADPAASVILLIGMAVGVDYSLFYVKREREERRRGHGDDALIRAAGTSGMAVLVSGGTVMIAMAGMLLSGSKIFTALGIASMLVVAAAVIGSLTVLPALLGKLGDRIDRGFTFIQRAKGRDRDTSRLWNLVLRPVLRHPWVATLASVWVLVLLALPALKIHTALPGLGDMSKSIPAVAAYDKIDKAFPGSQIPVTVVVKADNVDAPSVRNAIANMRHEAVASGLMNEPVTVAVNPSHTIAKVDLPLTGNGDDAKSNQALALLRGTILPATMSHVDHAVTGDTAGNRDFNQTVKNRFPYVFAFTLGLAFLLLLVTFRSIVVPLTAIGLNLLSV